MMYKNFLTSHNNNDFTKQSDMNKQEGFPMKNNIVDNSDSDTPPKSS